MIQGELRNIIQAGGRDDGRLTVSRRDVSGGVNTRNHPMMIGENQCEEITNMDIGTQGQTSKIKGSVLIANDVGSTTPVTIHNYIVQGAVDQLLMYEGKNLWKWEGTGNWQAIASLASIFVTASTECGMVNVKESGLAPDDVCIIQNGTDNPVRLASNGAVQDLGNTSGTTNDSPPKSTVMAWYGNRLWVLKNDLLYFSDAYSSDYSTAFDTATNWFRLPVGTERGLAATRNMGLIALGDDAIWGIFPSATPAATDRPEPIVTNVGCVSKNGWCMAGDDIYFFAKDGLRSLKRTEQDKVVLGTNNPLSWNLKTNFELISWGYIENLSMVHYDGKIFISVPTGANTFDVWIYYIATNSFVIMDNIDPACWAKYKVGGEERLYYGKKGDGVVYRAWYGYTTEGTTTTNGTAITMTYQGREEDFGQPFVWKVGGEVEVEARAVGDYDVGVYAALDGGAYNFLGNLNLIADNAPVLPVDLPFQLGMASVARTKFHLDEWGRFRTVQIKLTNAQANTDDIDIYTVNLIAFPEEYETEDN